MSAVRLVASDTILWFIFTLILLYWKKKYIDLCIKNSMEKKICISRRIVCTSCFFTSLFFLYQTHVSWLSIKIEPNCKKKKNRSNIPLLSEPLLEN